MQEQGLAEQAYAAIKTNILSLRYAPGSALSEAGLSAELGLGRMPVRLAIRRLKTEGWLTAEFRCQIKVKSITAKDIAEIYQMRRLLEEQALEMIFTEGLTWEYSFRLEEKLLKIKAVQGDLYARELAEAAWHREMLQIFANGRLEQMYAAIQEEAVRIALNYMSREHTDYIESIIGGLEQFCLALRENRLEDARQILERDHWQGGAARAANQIRES